MKTTAMTIAAAICSHNQVGSLYPEQVLLATTGWVPATFSHLPFLPSWEVRAWAPLSSPWVSQPGTALDTNVT